MSCLVLRLVNVHASLNICENIADDNNTHDLIALLVH